MIDVHAHVEALLAALTSTGVRVYDSEPGRKVDGAREAPVMPYVVVYTDGGIRSSESLADGHDERAEMDAECHSVGADPRSARWAQSRVLSLAGVSPTVAGRVTVLQSVFSDRVRRDTDNPERTVFESRDGLTLVSLKA